MPLLEVRNLSVRYDRAQILNGLSLDVAEGEFVGVVGPNGAGKSTLLRAISGLVGFERRMKRGTDGDIALEGEVRFAGERIDALPAHEIRRRGLVHCPERRRPFRELTVEENLLAGAFLSSNKSETQRRLDHAFALFPRLAERRAQIAGTLSGGEQQMLSLSRALIVSPAVIIADEMSLGLAPLMVDLVFESLARARDHGVAIVLIEQFVHRALAFADTCAVISRGRVAWTGPAEDAKDEVLRQYLGRGEV